MASEGLVGALEDLDGAPYEPPGGLVGVLEDRDVAPYEPPGGWEGLVGALEESPGL